MYSIPEDQRDSMLAMLVLSHMRVRCVVVPWGGDQSDAEEEVSPRADMCSFSQRLRANLLEHVVLGAVVGSRGVLRGPIHVSWLRTGL